MDGHQFHRMVTAQQENIAACQQRGVVLSDSEKTAIGLMVCKIYGKIFEREERANWKGVSR